MAETRLYTDHRLPVFNGWTNRYARGRLHLPVQYYDNNATHENNQTSYSHHFGWPAASRRQDHLIGKSMKHRHDVGWPRNNRGYWPRISRHYIGWSSDRRSKSVHQGRNLKYLEQVRSFEHAEHLNNLEYAKRRFRLLMLFVATLIGMLIASTIIGVCFACEYIIIFLHCIHHFIYQRGKNNDNNNIRYFFISKLLAPHNIGFDTNFSRRAVRRNCSQKLDESY